MHAHVFQHVPYEGLGNIAQWLEEKQTEASWTRWFEPGATPPLPGDIDLLIILGGPMSANDDRDLPWLATERAAILDAIEAGTPTLGICLGAQQIARVLGARVFANPEREIGWWPIEPARGAAGPFADLFTAPTEAFHWHGETFDLPAGAIHLCRSAGCEQQSFSFQNHVLALQFHLETTPGSATDIIEHSDQQNLPGRFVQPAESMLADPSLFSTANHLMIRTLDRLTASSHGG